MADLTTLLSKFLQNLSLYSGGVSGALTVDTTQAGTAADTTETDLWTYTLPANTLSANGKGLRITPFVDAAANANTKRVRVYFGSTAILDSTAQALNGSPFHAAAHVIRTGASAQYAHGWINVPGVTSGVAKSSTPAENTTGAITIKVTGQNGTASANDIVFRGVVVELLN